MPARSWTVDLLHHDTFSRYSKDPAQFRLEAEEKIRSGARTIFVDEIDLLMERHGRLVLALEIKAKRRVVSADISGLRSFAEAHPSIPRVVIALVPEGTASATHVCYRTSVSSRASRTGSDGTGKILLLVRDDRFATRCNGAAW